MSDEPDQALGPEPRRLDAHLRGRTFGLIATRKGYASDQSRHVPTTDPARQAAQGLGLVTLVTHRLVGEHVAPGEKRAGVTLLLLGPVGDDHGRVVGALRALGARSGQVIAMCRPYDTDMIAAIRLDARDAASASEVWADRYVTERLGGYCAALRGEPFDHELVLEACTDPSFFSRQMTRRQVRVASAL